MMKWAKKYAADLGADFKVYVTKTQNSKTDPLDHFEKVEIISHLPGMFGRVAESGSFNLFGIIKELQDEGFTEVILVCGGDKYKTYCDLFEKYHDDYTIELSVVKFAERDKYPISATQMRQAAREGDYVTFMEGCPEPLSPFQRLDVYRRVSVALQGSVRPPHEKTRELLYC